MSFITDTNVDLWVTADSGRGVALKEISQNRQGVTDFELEIDGQVVRFKAIYMRLIVENMFEPRYEMQSLDIPQGLDVSQHDLLKIIKEALECHGLASNPEMTRAVHVQAPCSF